MGIIFYLRKEPINFTPIIRKVKSKSHFFPSQNPNFDFSLQQIWFFLLRTQSQNRIFLLKFRLFTPRNLFFSAFTLKNRKVKSKPDFSSAQNPNFDFSLQNSVFFYSEPKFNFSLQESSQNRIFLLLKTQMSIFHSKVFLIFVAFWEFCGIFGLLWFFLTCVVLFGSYGIFWLLWYLLTFVSHEIQFYPTKFLNNRQKNRISILLPRYKVNIRT